MNILKAATKWRKEQPGAYAVDAENHVFIAEGGNDYDRAKCWIATTL